MPNIRNPYTSDDDSLLVKYIAKYNPQDVGRSGNALYKTLTDNDKGRWSWAERHSWQSWRDHYCKSKDYFDRKIRQYQKKHGIAASETRKVVTATPKKKVRDVEESESEEETEDVEDNRKRKRQSLGEARKRQKNERGRRENLEEEEEEDKGEGPSRGALGGRIMSNRPVSTVKEAQGGSQARQAKIGVNLEDRSLAGEKQNNDIGSDDRGEDEEEKNPHGPVGSDNYEDLFGPSEDEIEETEVIELTDTHAESETEDDMDAQEVNEQLAVASKQESTTGSSRDKSETAPRQHQSGDHETLYPTIESVPSPHIRARETGAPRITGAYDVSSSNVPPTKSTSASELSKPHPPPPQASPSKSTLPPPPSLGKPGPSPRRSLLAYAHVYPSAVLAPDEDFFGSPSTPTPASQNAKVNGTRTQPPKLVEGPYGNKFAGTRRSSGWYGDTDSDDEQEKQKAWPPARNRTASMIARENGKPVKQEKVVKGKGKVNERGDVMINNDKGKSVDKGKAKAIPIPVDAQPGLSKPVTSAPRPRPPTQVNAEPSSSRTRLSDLPSRSQAPSPSSGVSAAPQAEPAPRPRHVAQSSDSTRHAPLTSVPPENNTRSGSGQTLPTGQAGVDLGTGTTSDPRRRQLAAPHANAVDAQRNASMNDWPAVPNGQAKNGLSLTSRIAQNGSSKRRPSSLRKEMSFPMPSESWTPGNPFVDRPISSALPQAVVDGRTQDKQKGKARDDHTRRHTIGFFHVSSEAGRSGRRIDLREELARSTGAVHARQSLPLRSRTTSLHSTPDRGRLVRRSVSADARNSPLLALPKTDEDLATVQYLGVTRALSLIAKNTSFSEEAVMRVWEKMESIARTEEYFERLKPVVGDASEKIFEMMEMEKEQQEKSLASEPQSSPERIDLERHLSTSPHRSAHSERQDLNVRPLRQDDDAMSDYSPPHSSRAGQYSRLVKQGRREEALKRERRRASLGVIGESFPREVSTPKESSQDSEVEVVEENQTEDAVPRTRSPSVDAEDIDPFELEPPDEWGGEEEAMFASASMENAELLREIESRMPPEFMRKWTVLHLMNLRQQAQS